MALNRNHEPSSSLTIGEIAAMLKALSVKRNQRIIATLPKPGRPPQVLAHLTLSDDEAFWQVIPTASGQQYWGQSIQPTLAIPPGHLTDEKPVGNDNDLIKQLVKSGDTEHIFVAHNASELIVQSLQPTASVEPSVYSLPDAFTNIEVLDSPIHHRQVTVLSDGVVAPSVMRQVVDGLPVQERNNAEKALIVEFYALKQLQRLSGSIRKQTLHANGHEQMYTLLQIEPSRQCGLYTRLDCAEVPASEIAANTSLIGAETVAKRLRKGLSDNSLSTLFKLCGLSGVRRKALLTRLIFTAMVRQRSDVHKNFQVHWAVDQQVSAKFAPQMSCWPNYIANGEPAGEFNELSSIDSFFNGYPGLNDIIGNDTHIRETAWNNAVTLYREMAAQLQKEVGELGLSPSTSQAIVAEFSTENLPQKSSNLTNVQP